MTPRAQVEIVVPVHNEEDQLLSSIRTLHDHLLRTVLRPRFSDAQCGFRAIRAEAARQLLPRVQDDGWFFDTELLVLAQRDGLRIHEVPVD